jgi:parallel beta-helix repeat protein
MVKNRNKIPIFQIVILIFLPVYLHSNIWYVHPDSVLNTIQAGLDSCSIGDTVLVASGIYYENLIWPATEGILLISESGPEVTIIDGGEAGSVIQITTGVDTTTIINGFTIQNGYSEKGGGIYCYNSSPKIINNIIRMNTAEDEEGGYGGAIYLKYSNSIISNNLISQNVAYYDSIGIYGGEGGGIYITQSSPSILQNDIYQNIAENLGGGIFCDYLSYPIIDGNYIKENENCGIYTNMGSYSTIVNNTIDSNEGSGIVSKGFGTISLNIITNNTAMYGGGIMMMESVVISGNMISYNTSHFQGGGIFVGPTSGTITGNIITYNTSEVSEGGGIYCGLTAHPTITGNIIVGNKAYEDGGGICCDIDPFSPSPVIGGSPSGQNDIYHNSAGWSGNNLFATRGLNAKYNFWGRVNSTPDDSSAIASNISCPWGTINWWPISTTPLTVTFKIKSPSDKLCFAELEITFEELSFNSFGDSTITVTTWPDSLPPYLPSPSKPIEKWFEIIKGSGIESFTANLTLHYTQAEFDSSDIYSEFTIYCAILHDTLWDSCTFLGRDTIKNWIKCQTQEFGIFAIGGEGGPLVNVKELQDNIVYPHKKLDFIQIFPNPFSVTSGTQIKYYVPEIEVNEKIGTEKELNISLNVYDVNGRLVCSLLNKYVKPGYYTMFWKGKNNLGEKLPSGVYFIQLKSEKLSYYRKFIILK